MESYQLYRHSDNYCFYVCESIGIICWCVIVVGFTPDVKVWEVCFDKSGAFQEVKRAFELKGHTAGVYCFSFSSDSRRLVVRYLLILIFYTLVI